jgi:hypothetical protein
MNPRVYFHIQISSIEASIPTGLRAAGVLQWNSPRRNSSTHGPLFAPCTTPESRLKEGGRRGGHMGNKHISLSYSTIHLYPLPLDWQF